MMERIAVAWNWVSETMRKLSSGWHTAKQARFVTSFLEAWWWGVGALVRPVQFLQRAAEEKPVLSALWLTLLQGLSLALGTRYAAAHNGFVLSWLIKDLPSGWLVALYILTFPPALWFVKAAILNLVAELLGGPPRGLSLLAATAVACSPLLLVLPVALIAAALSPDLDTGFISHLWFVFALGVHAWWVVLTLIAIRETYRFTLAQALLTLLIPSVVGLPLAYIIYRVLSVVA